MSLKKTIIWLIVAGGLFSFIYFYQRHVRPPVTGPGKVLPELRADAVTSILVRPSGPVQLQIRVDRTNGIWQLAQPLSYPAATQRVQKLLNFLEQMRPAPYLTAAELRSHTNADEEFGFAAPQATVVIQQGPYIPRLRVGALTNPGDQVFIQVEGDLGAYVVDAELLKYLPRSADDWRDSSLIHLAALPFDRIGVTNNSKGDSGRSGLPASSSTFVLQRDSTNRLWRMVWPLDARANDSRIEEALDKLQQLRIRRFVSDEPKSDLEPLGLAPADLELGLASGTNNLALLQFGRSPTNEESRVFAHRASQPGVVTVDKDLLLGWCAVLNDFRDPHLMGLPTNVATIELVSESAQSSLQHRADGTWRILPEGFAADESLVNGLLSTLTNIEITKFENDVVNRADLPKYGLLPPVYRLLVTTVGAPSADNHTNTSITELDFGFGTNLQDKVYAKRTDENCVYAISTNDYARLPSGSWLMRDRTLCRFTVADVTGLTFRSGGKICQMIHKAPLSWSFAPGSQGIINDAAVEETVRGIVETSAIAWAGRGLSSKAGFGFTEAGPRLTFELRNGTKFDLEFGSFAPSGNVYACLMLEDQPWVLEFPWLLFRDINSYLPLSPQR